MKLLILDNTMEAQTMCAKRIEYFSQRDIEMLDLQVHLVNESEFLDKLPETDVLVIGSGVGEHAIALVRQALAKVSWLNIIMFVKDSEYGGGIFRSAHSWGVRKVFADSATPLDFLQELVAIHTEFRQEGRAREGCLVAVTHAKGGVGATSVAAALAEVCSVYHRRTMLWDMDVETRDLSRALTVIGSEAKIVSNWVNGSQEITRQSLIDALIPISGDVSVLMPPDKLAESMDLICHTDGMGIVQRVAELSKVLFDVIIIDTAGRMGPAAGAIMRAADIVLIVIDDTILGLTAVDLYLNLVKSLVGGTESIVFLVNPYSGSSLGVDQIAKELEPAHNLGAAPWRLPELSNDPRAALWPGSGRTLYSMGQKSTRNTFEAIAKELGLITVNKEDESKILQKGSGGGLLQKVFKKK